MTFGTVDLLHTLRALPRPSGYLVAYSGGLDSQVLLHAMAQLRGQLRLPLRAIHINHGLQADADYWEQTCRQVCAQWQIDLHTQRVALNIAAGVSLEAEARSARYAAIAAGMHPQEMLLTAQHLDDQAETLLLQLLRGAGAEGLAGMPACRRWHSGWQARPLLEVARADLAAYAEQQHLQWIEDPSNQDPRFDRNYLRHTVMPLLQQRWPAANKTLARSASLLGDAVQRLKPAADQDLAACEAEHGTLSVRTLLQLPRPRRYAALRAWFQRHALSVPDQARMQQIDNCVLQAGPEASPQVAWGEVVLRRYRDGLYLLPQAQQQQAPDTFEAAIDWPDQDELQLPDGSRLRREPADTGVPLEWWQQQRLQIRWRVQDTRCRPHGRQGTRSFKKLCQELGIPPWMRARLPLLYKDDDLIAVADYCQCGDIDQISSQQFYRLQWRA